MTKQVVSRSNILLLRPNLEPSQSMPLGNGRMGAAVWSADGLTVQLNRDEADQRRRTTTRITLHGLTALTNSHDYHGSLNLYDGVFIEQGGGIRATVAVLRQDVLAIDVVGMVPDRVQTLTLALPAARTTHVSFAGGIGVIAEDVPGSRRGALMAVAAVGRSVSMRASADAMQVRLLPHRDGSFHLLVALPRWRSGSAAAAARRAILPLRRQPVEALLAPSRNWWHDFWGHADALQLHSADGVADYMEALRTIYLYTAAAEDRDRYPSSHYGNGGLFAWSPGSDLSDYWQFNLRMQVAANAGAGLTELNLPYFRLYRDNLASIRAWTIAKMDGRSGLCVPETMRIDGQGIQEEIGTDGKLNTYFDCNSLSAPMWNARTLSSGAEVAIWMWRHYRQTGDRRFLARHYPVMAGAARFLLSYIKPGNDGLLHSFPSNAHEVQWDVRDPTTDLAAMKALFPIVSEAAALLGRDAALRRQLAAALPRIPVFPLTDQATHRTLFGPDERRRDDAVIAPSYQPGAPRHNIENVGLEPLWPYDVLDLADPATLALARRTYAHRETVYREDWSYDAVDAARLGLADEVQRDLVAITQKYQIFPSGLANLYFGKATEEPFVEQSANVAVALQESLVQENGKTVLIANAVPSGWSGAGTVTIHDGSKISVTTGDGRATAVTIAAARTGSLRLRNPWQGLPLEAAPIDRTCAAPAMIAEAGDIWVIGVHAGCHYRLASRLVSKARSDMIPDLGGKGPSVKHLGSVTIGLDAAPA